MYQWLHRMIIVVFILGTTSLSAQIAVLNYTGTIPQSLKLQSEHLLNAQGLRLGVSLGAVHNNQLVRTLVNDSSKEEPIFYQLSSTNDLNQAIKNLRESEGYVQKEFIGYVNLDSGNFRGKDHDLVNKIKNWGRRKGFFAVIWVDENPLPSIKDQETWRVIYPLLEQDDHLLVNTQNYINKTIASHLRTPLEKEILLKSSSHSVQAIGDQYEASIQNLVLSRTDKNLKQTTTPFSQWYKSSWGTWGPYALFKEKITFPSFLSANEKRPWAEKLVIAMARHYEGLQYKGKWPSDLRGGRPDPFAQHPEQVPNSQTLRGHFPGRGLGLDCSNYMAWVYGLIGLHIDSDINELIDYVNFPRRNAKYGTVIWSKKRDGATISYLRSHLRPGDLIVFDGEVGHVMIYLGKGDLIGKQINRNGYYIDSTRSSPSGVGIRSYDSGWAKLINNDRLHPRFVGVIRPLDLLF